MEYNEGDHVAYEGSNGFTGTVTNVSGRTVTVHGEDEVRTYDAEDLSPYREVVRAFEFEELIDGEWHRTTRIAHPADIGVLNENEYRNVRELRHL